MTPTPHCITNLGYFLNGPIVPAYKTYQAYLSNLKEFKEDQGLLHINKTKNLDFIHLKFVIIPICFAETYFCIFY